MRLMIGASALAFASASSAASLTVLSTAYDGSFTYLLGDKAQPYYVPAEKNSKAVASYAVSSCEQQLVPITVLVSNASMISASMISDTISSYLEDDVYDEGFLEGLQIITTTKSSALDKDAEAYLLSLKLSHLLLDSSISSNITSATSFTKASVTPPGPYIGKCSSGSLALYKTYGTFYDQYDSFTSSFALNDDASYSYVRHSHPEQMEMIVPYPSRLYSSLLDPQEYPLAGLRFAIKDIIDVKGIITGGGSREYARLYNTPKNATAPSMNILIDMGAVVIGKTKPATFAWGAWPDQNVDIPYPWNPRADKYLGLSASSHGSASAIAAYPQLDFVIGTDTGGSVRNPADRAGVYGLRPTWSVIDVEGCITSAKTLDAIGFLARSPLLSHKLAHLWEGASNTAALVPGNFTYPKKIIYPVEWFPVNSTVAQNLIDSWLVNVTEALGMMIEQQNTSALFQSWIGGYNGTLGDWTQNVSSVNIKDNWDTMGRQFIADYEAANDGQYPELDISVRVPWSESPTYTQEYYDANVNRSWEFTDFWNSEVIKENAQTCSDGLWIYQIADTGGGVPEYRDRTLDYFPDFAGAMRGASIAPFAHTVDITVPIGQIPYDSLISHVEEQLAITLSFVAHRGCDLALMEFVKACADAGYCKEVKTGRTAF